MNFIWDKITEWLKGLLVSGIISNLSGLFDAINTRVGEASAQRRRHGTAASSR